MFGVDGEDIILEVFLGIVVRDVEIGEVEFEIIKYEEECVLFSGGWGGLGNSYFKFVIN